MANNGATTFSIVRSAISSVTSGVVQSAAQAATGVAEAAADSEVGKAIGGKLSNLLTKEGSKSTKATQANKTIANSFTNPAAFATQGAATGATTGAAMGGALGGMPGAGLGAALGAGMGGLGDIAKKVQEGWKGKGADGCGPGGCNRPPGGGGPSPGSGPSGGQGVSPGAPIPTEKGSTGEKLSNAMMAAGDKPLEIKFGENSRCGPCRTYDATYLNGKQGSETGLNGATLYKTSNHNDQRPVLKVEMEKNSGLNRELGVPISSIPHSSFAYRKTDGSIGMAASYEEASKAHTKIGQVETVPKGTKDLNETMPYDGKEIAALINRHKEAIAKSSGLNNEQLQKVQKEFGKLGEQYLADPKSLSKEGQKVFEVMKKDQSIAEPLGNSLNIFKTSYQTMQTNFLKEQMDKKLGLASKYAINGSGEHGCFDGRCDNPPRVNSSSKFIFSPTEDLSKLSKMADKNSLNFSITEEQKEKFKQEYYDKETKTWDVDKFNSEAQQQLKSFQDEHLAKQADQ